MQETQEVQVWSLGQEDPLERTWQPILIFLCGESHGQRRVEGYHSWGHKESDMLKQQNMHTHLLFPTHLPNLTFSWQNILYTCLERKCFKCTLGRCLLNQAEAEIILLFSGMCWGKHTYTREHFRVPLVQSPLLWMNWSLKEWVISPGHIFDIMSHVAEFSAHLIKLKWKEDTFLNFIHV